MTNNAKALQKAIEFYKAGRAKEAELICTEIIRKQPDNGEALHLLGVLSFQCGSLDASIGYLSKALRHIPSNPYVHFNLGNAYKNRREFDKAISCYQKALQLNPSLFEAYHNLGMVFQNNNQLDEAIANYRKTLQFNPNQADVYYNLGLIFKDRAQLEDAIDCFRKALQLNPNDSNALNNLGLVFLEKKQNEEAMTCFQKALQRDPDNVVAYYGLADVFKSTGQLQEAIDLYRKSLHLVPDNIGVYLNIGMFLSLQGKLTEAMTCYQKALLLNPGHAEAHCKLGACLQVKLQYTEAEDHYRTAMRLNPTLADAYSNLGNILAERGNMSEAESYHRYALQINPYRPFYFSSLLFMMHNTSRHDAQTVFSEHLRFAKQFEVPLLQNIRPHPNTRIADRRLKVGYVSPDFRKHSVACFFEPALMSHNREHFEVFCYSASFYRDEVTERLRRHADQWRDIAEMPDEKAADLIRNDRIDILVDLAGHTARNRLLLFARKPAPVQVSWIGYPATTGLSSMDYKIVDAYTDPPGMTEQLYTEKLLRLPQSFLCYIPENESPDPGELPALGNGHVTFGSFNNFAKISRMTVEIWAHLLKLLPGSRLILKAPSLSDRAAREYALKMFADEAIPGERITLLGWVPSPQGHLDTYKRIDIGLDTFPYNGTTTTCEALWMGVPVVTLSGTTHASRVGVSLLSNIRLTELIAKTPDEYVATAMGLAGDLKKLQGLRGSLRHMMTHSVLTDSVKFVSDLENCYRFIWRKWCGKI